MQYTSAIASCIPVMCHLHIANGNNIQLLVVSVDNNFISWTKLSVDLHCRPGRETVPNLNSNKLSV